MTANILLYNSPAQIVIEIALNWQNLTILNGLKLWKRNCHYETLLLSFRNVTKVQSYWRVAQLNSINTKKYKILQDIGSTSRVIWKFEKGVEWEIETESCQEKLWKQKSVMTFYLLCNFRFVARINYCCWVEEIHEILIKLS